MFVAPLEGMTAHLHPPGPPLYLFCYKNKRSDCRYTHKPGVPCEKNRMEGKTTSCTFGFSKSVYGMLKIHMVRGSFPLPHFQFPQAYHQHRTRQHSDILTFLLLRTLVMQALASWQEYVMSQRHLLTFSSLPYFK